ncbi:adenosine deaminase [Oceanicola sp. D3]|uniref:adenosine deaminase n=1 Tax=Oceanicola sp. D3 TaxID=2587163 RepID=UPI001122CF9C|nr:adenosine deaminase [Oceanicola sp. D3]QDC08654.1 adenosine deaminase [Oceanicola sp. D3]
MSWKQLPKTELHLHLEGAAPPEFIRSLAKEKKADIGGIFDEQGNYAYANFAEFLKVYEAATSVLTTPEDYARLTRVVLEQCAEHGVIYAETFLSPDFCGGGDVKAWWEYCAAMAEVAEEAEKDLGITLKGIITCIRHFGPEKARAPAICAAESAGDFITGFGMAGAETVGKPGDYAWAFDCAREAGLRLTCHAGEWGGPEMVRATLDQLEGIERIGHGVAAYHDGPLMERLAENGITLEVCPGSNIALGVFRHWHDHPIEKLRENGVAVTVSTDDPPFFHTTMTREYEKLNEVFGWDEGDFAALNEDAMAAAFCDEKTREDILKRLKT